MPKVPEFLDQPEKVRNQAKLANAIIFAMEDKTYEQKVLFMARLLTNVNEESLKMLNKVFSVPSLYEAKKGCN